MLGLLAAASMTCGVREHAVHPDGQLRRRRLRCRQHRASASPAWSSVSASSSPSRRPSLADRIGRRRVIVVVAWLGAVAVRARRDRRRRSVCSSSPRRSAARWAWRSRSSSASSPPRRCRATAGPTPSASWRWPAGFGAGVAVLALRLADVGPQRMAAGATCVSLVWCVVALDLARAACPRPAGSPPRHITQRDTSAADQPRADCWPASPRWRSSATSSSRRRASSRTATSPTCRDSAGGMIGLFSLTIGDAGRHRTDRRRPHGRHGRPGRLHRLALPVSTVVIVGAFMVSGPSMWILSLIGGVDRQRRLPGARRLPRRAVPHRQPEPGRRAGDRGVARSVACFGLVVDGCLLDARLDVRRDPGACWRSASSS